MKTTMSTHQQTNAHLNQKTTSKEAGYIEEADAQGFLNHRILIKLVSKLCLQLHLQNVHLTSCPFLDRSPLNHSVVMGGCVSDHCRLYKLLFRLVPVVGRRSTCDLVRAPLAGKKQLAN